VSLVVQTSTKRVRRTPENARAEILAAAEAALREAGFLALTVEHLMERTGMTRSLFYHYFKSLDEIVIALFESVEAEIQGAVDAWLEGEDTVDPRANTVEHLTRMYEVWREHANLMRAMEQAAGRSKEAYARWQSHVVESYIDKTESFIRRQIQLGRSRVSDPRGVAQVLILMNLAVATDQTNRPEPETPARLGAMVGHVWNAAVYQDA
jgi:TetR/AcrR family transcriptional regulator, ethionamide resistance regulator